jgi:hypothetical protein
MTQPERDAVITRAEQAVNKRRYDGTGYTMEAVTCITDLLSLVRSLEAERDTLKAERDGERGVLAMTVARLGGTVEGRPTERVNFLQRIDELRKIEAERDYLNNDRIALMNECNRLQLASAKDDMPRGSAPSVPNGEDSGHSLDLTALRGLSAKLQAAGPYEIADCQQKHAGVCGNACYVKWLKRELDAFLDPARPQQVQEHLEPSEIKGIPDEGRLLSARQIEQVMDALESDDKEWRIAAFEMIQELYESDALLDAARPTIERQPLNAQAHCGDGESALHELNRDPSTPKEP